MQVILQTNFGPRAVTIQKVGMSVVDVDLNRDGRQGSALRHRDR
jgi:hypothetical protein